MMVKFGASWATKNAGDSRRKKHDRPNEQVEHRSLRMSRGSAVSLASSGKAAFDWRQ
jgi:hypothetical protein